jgi:hypothetical protein
MVIYREFFRTIPIKSAIRLKGIIHGRGPKRPQAARVFPFGRNNSGRCLERITYFHAKSPEFFRVNLLDYFNYQ